MSLRVPDHITWKNLEGATVLLDLSNSNYFTLNETATFLWRQIVDGKSEKEIQDSLMRDFDCDEQQASADLQESLDFLLHEELVTKGPEG